MRAPHALWVFGNHYYYGKGVEADVATAAALYEEAAETGFPYAQINLGVMYRNGEHFDVDLTRALEYFDKASPNSEHAAMLANELRQQLDSRTDV